MTSPDRYAHNLDPGLARLLHTVVGRGWGNETIGELPETGWQTTKVVISPDEQPEFADALGREVPAGIWLVTQEASGRVTLDAYPTPADAHRAFDDLVLTDTVPGEEDATITPTGPLGSRYAVAFGHKFLGDVDDLPGAYTLIRAEMHAEGFYPDVWWISDHGNAHRLTLPDLD